MTVALIQSLIPYGLKAVEEKLQAEVELLAGERYQHGKENTRWGDQPGSVYLRDQKLPIKVPRVRNKKDNTEVSLETYQRLQQPYLSDRQTMLKLLNGISMRKYTECVEFVPEVFGITGEQSAFKIICPMLSWHITGTLSGFPISIAIFTLSFPVIIFFQVRGCSLFVLV